MKQMAAGGDESERGGDEGLSISNKAAANDSTRADVSQ